MEIKEKTNKWKPPLALIIANIHLHYSSRDFPSDPKAEIQSTNFDREIHISRQPFAKGVKNVSSLNI